MPVSIDESKVQHIFRDAEGHFDEDNRVNRQLLIDVATRSANRIGVDQFGNTWFAEIRPDGRQIWVQVREDRITNGGINRTPRVYRF